MLTYADVCRFKEGLVRDKIWDIDELRKAVGVIEISRSGVLERAYFIIPSICSYLTEVSAYVSIRQHTSAFTSVRYERARTRLLHHSEHLLVPDRGKC